MISMNAFAQPALADRGIYWADYTLDGKPVMYGVSSAGEVVALLSVPLGSEPEAERRIQQALDVTDPRPLVEAAPVSHLRLLHGE